jgi:hypothetical protein
MHHCPGASVEEIITCRRTSEMEARSSRKESLTPLAGPEDLQEFFKGYTEREKRRRMASAKVSVSQIDVSNSKNNLLVVLVIISAVLSAVVAFKFVVVG